MFACPVCGLPLISKVGSSDLAPSAGTRLSGVMVCEAGHTFDVAKQGYVSLVTGDSHIVGDTAHMVQARASFLASGVYEPIAHAVIDMLKVLEDNRETTDKGAVLPSCCATVAASIPAEDSDFMDSATGAHLVRLHRMTGVGAGAQRRTPGRRATFADLGGGTGYYSTLILDALPTWDGVLLDVSKHAAKIAARTHPRLRVATADLRTRIPLVDASVDAALVVFAPRNTPEIRRILHADGVCIVVTPTQNHLHQLRATLPMINVDPDKEERLTRQFADFTWVETREVEYQVELPHDVVLQIIGMGPSAFHTESADLNDHIPESVNTTISVNVRVFRPSVPHRRFGG